MIKRIFDNRLTVSKHIIKSEKISGVIRILLLADLHSTCYGYRQRELVSLIKTRSPDVVCIAGDLIDERRSFACVADLLRGIINVAPVYFVTGNHEYRIENIGYYLRKMQRLGVKVLSDEAACIEISGERLLIAGVNDPEIKRHKPNYSQEQSMQKAFSHLRGDDGVFKLLLAHRPGCFERYIKYPFELILSGHEHGGQVRIPLVDVGLYSHRRLFPKYTAGMHNVGNSRLVISRGLSYFAHVPRVFNPPELVEIILKGKGI